MSTIAQTVKPKETLNFAHLAHRSVKDKASLENLIIVKKGLGAWHNKMCTVDDIYFDIYFQKLASYVFCSDVDSPEKQSDKHKWCSYLTPSIDILVPMFSKLDFFFYIHINFSINI